MSTWTELHDAKRGVAEMLAKASMLLQGPGVDAEELREALALASTAKLTLTGCENALTALMQRQARQTDTMLLRAGKEAV